MAFTFPDPNVTPEFTGPNAITYSWDVNDKKWVVKSTGSENLYLLKRGETVEAGEVVHYEWNQPVDIKSEDTLTLQGGKSALLGADDGLLSVQSSNGSVSISGKNTVSVFADTQDVLITGRKNVSITAVEKDISLDASNGNELVSRSIDYTTELDKQITNKEYVDNRDELLLNGLIDLQEEIDAIAPSLQKGAWEWDDNTDPAVTPKEGHYFLLKADGTVTDEYNQTVSVVFHKTDAGGTEHDNWDLILGDPNSPDYPATDKLILLFDKPDPDKCLGKITNIQDIGEVGNPYGDDAVVVEFNRLEAEGKPNNALDENGKYITYVNIFTEPSGGDASEFILKKGDDVTCDIKPITFPNKTTSTGLLTSSSSVQAKIKFKTEDTNNSANKEEVNVWQPGVKNALMTNGSIYSKNNLYAQYLKGWDGSTETTPSIQLNVGAGYLKHNGNDRFQWGSDGGQFKVGSNVFLKWTNTDSYLQYRGANRLYWGSSGVSITKPVNNNTTAVGFKIKGSTIYSDSYGSSSIGNNDGSLLYVQHVNGQSDSIRYKGRQADDYDLVTVKYVKDNAGSSGNFVKRGGNTDVTITYSNGNFLIANG